jgi:tRNA A-37 threonylcarbamoyl transferase component Bud32
VSPSGSLDLALLSSIPSDYVVERSSIGVLAVRRGLEAGFAAAGFTSKSDPPLAVSDLSGRKPLYALELPDRPDERFVLRRYTHGGLLRWLTGTRFLAAERPFRELLVAQELTRAGIATPELVAARARRAPGWGFRLEVVSRRVEGAQDLGYFLELARRGQVSLRAQRRILRAAGELVGALHGRGFLHADLTPRNLLLEQAALDGGAPRLWVLDLEGSRIWPELSETQRADNLRRLFRHVVRLELEGRARLTRTDRWRFLCAYQPRADLRRVSWRAIERRHRRRQAWHATGWLLERMLAGGSRKPASPTLPDRAVAPRKSSERA